MGLFKSVAGFLEEKIDLSNMNQAQTVTGEDIKELNLKILAFYVGTSYIIDTLSKCEIKRVVKGKEVKDQLYYLFNVSPNMNQNATELKRKLLYTLYFENEALLFEEKGKLYVADSFLREHRPLKGDLFTNITLKDETKTFVRKAEDVFYFNLGEQNIKSLVDGIISEYIELMSYSMEIYKSNGDEKYKLILDNIKAGDTQFNEEFEKVVKKQLETFINNRKAVYPQFKGYNLEKISKGDGKTDSTDVRNLEKEVFEITSKCLKMPISMLYGNMTNVKEVIMSFITFTIDPLAKMIEEELTRKTGTMNDYLEGTYLNVDTTRIMHIDIFEVADKIDKLLANGTYTIDELRIKVGDTPLNTDFSEQHWMTKNYSTIENALIGEPKPSEVNSSLEGGD